MRLLSRRENKTMTYYLNWSVPLPLESNFIASLFYVYSIIIMPIYQSNLILSLFSL